MSTPETHSTNPSANAAGPSPAPRRWRGIKRIAVAAVIAVAGGAALSAFAFEGRHGPGMGGPGMMMMFGERGMDRMLDGLNATDQQRTQIKQIMKGVADDLRAGRDQQRALMDRALQVYTAPTVDANAAEQVRQQLLAQHDTASKRITLAMVEASRVLTPEQRSKLAERLQERRARMQERMQREAAPATR